MKEPTDIYYRFSVTVVLSRTERHGVWADSPEKAKELLEKEVESNYSGFNIDDIEFEEEEAIAA